MYTIDFCLTSADICCPDRPVFCLFLVRVEFVSVLGECCSSLIGAAITPRDLYKSTLPLTDSMFVLHSPPFLLLSHSVVFHFLRFNRVSIAGELHSRERLFSFAILQ